MYVYKYATKCNVKNMGDCIAYLCPLEFICIIV